LVIIVVVIGFFIHYILRCKKTLSLILNYLTMSDESSKGDQTNDGVPKNPLAKEFFDKLIKDGPKRDKVGQSFVINFSQTAQNPIKESSSDTEKQSQIDLGNEWDDTISASRSLRQLRVEIIKEVREIRKESDSKPTNDTDNNQSEV